MNRPHHIKIVAFDALPADTHYAFLDCGEELWLVLKADHFTPATLEDAWATYRAMGRLQADAAGGHTPVPGCCPLAGHEPLAAQSA
jgi:hypothetical protein